LKSGILTIKVVLRKGYSQDPHDCLDNSIASEPILGQLRELLSFAEKRCTWKTS
jgi:hypothetical protein